MADQSQSEIGRARLSRVLARIWVPLCVLALAALLLALPMLMYGPMPSGHDTFEHINFTRHFAQQFWHGELSPRWLLNLNHGLGSATFFVYPPFTCYVYSLLQPLGEALHFNAFIAMATLALFASGVSAFLWIRTMAGQGISLALAVLYMLMPYHLVGDVYRRAAFPECWALVWMPLLLYFVWRMVKARRGAIAGIAIAYGLLLLSQPTAAVIFFVIPPLVALTLAAPGCRIGPPASVCGGMLLGIGLASFYLLPALFHSRYFPVSKLDLPLDDNLLPLGRSLLQSRLFTRVLALTVDSMFIFAAVCGAAAFGRARPEQRRQILFWLAMCVASAFLMSRFSAVLWTRLPWLLEAVQFPWRFNLVLCIAALPLAAIFASEISWPTGWWRACALAVAFFLVATWLFAYANVVRDYSDTTPFTHDPISEADGWFDAWKAPGTDSTAALAATAEPPVRFVSGTGSLRVLQWKPRLLEVQTSSGSGGLVVMNQFYYPEWKARIAGQPGGLPVTAALPQGLLQVQVPPGEHNVRMEIPVGPAERAGRWLSLFSVLVGLGLIWPARH